MRKNAPLIPISAGNFADFAGLLLFQKFNFVNLMVFPK